MSRYDTCHCPTQGVQVLQKGQENAKRGSTARDSIERQHTRRGGSVNTMRANHERNVTRVMRELQTALACDRELFRVRDLCMPLLQYVVRAADSNVIIRAPFITAGQRAGLAAGGPCSSRFLWGRYAIYTDTLVERPCT